MKSTIARALAPIVKYGTEADVIDAMDRVWHVITNHSGFILNGLNHPAHIPYWSSYFLDLPGLRQYEGPLPVAKIEPRTIAEVITAGGEGIYQDAAGIDWYATLCTQSVGFELEMCRDNGWLPWKSCGVLWLPGFELRQTKAQMEARNLEFVS